jgi:uronate dehydrogenase
MTTTISKKPFKRLLLTGAAGGLGRILRERIKPWAEVVRLTDLDDLGAARPGEEIAQCDLADKAAVKALMTDVDAVLHFGGISVEARFEDLVQANIIGTYNLYEAVHAAGVRRVIYASSNHAVGFYRTTDRVDAGMPLRPDGMYGLSKCFGETLSRYYYDRFAIETVCLRIGFSFPAPKDARTMVTYLSYDDLVELIRSALFTLRVDHTIVFGSSDNPQSWWDNSKAAHLGFRPQDSSAAFVGSLPDNSQWPRADDAATSFQGGAFIPNSPIYDQAN